MAEEVKKKRPPLDPNSAKARLGKIAAEAYSSAQAAKERGEMVGWCSSNFPVEIPETLLPREPGGRYRGPRRRRAHVQHQ